MKKYIIIFKKPLKKNMSRRKQQTQSRKTIKTSQENGKEQ